MVLPKERAAMLGLPERQELTWTTEHPCSHYRLGVLLFTDGELLDGAGFRELRDNIGAHIESDQPLKALGALGLPPEEPGIVQIKDGAQ